MTAKALHQALTQKRQDLSALQDDLPKIAALLEQHTTAADDAKAQSAPYDRQAELRGRAAGFESVLTQHKADIGALEAEITDLQTQYDTQTTKDKHTASWAAHEALLTEYRKGTRELLSDVLTKLKDLKGLEAQILKARREIEQLGVTLGVYKRDPIFGDVKGTGFSERNLTLPRLPWLFDELFPKLPTDDAVLSHLEQIANSGALKTIGHSRHELIEAQSAHEAKAAAQMAERQAEAQAKLDERRGVREQMGIR